MEYPNLISLVLQSRVARSTHARVVAIGKLSPVSEHHVVDRDLSVWPGKVSSWTMALVVAEKSAMRTETQLLVLAINRFPREAFPSPRQVVAIE